MNTNDIIRMARQAGLINNYGGRETADDESLARFAKLVTAFVQPQLEVFGWAILHSDRTPAYQRDKMKNFFGHITEREPFDASELASADREWPGLAPHTMVTLYTVTPVDPDWPGMVKAIWGDEDENDGG